MPRKSKNLNTKKKEVAAQKQIQKQKSKERQRARLEKEFVASQLARGMHVRTMVLREALSEEMMEAVIVYRLKDGCADPFDKDNVVYLQDPSTNAVVQQEKVSSKEDMRAAVERFANINLKEEEDMRAAVERFANINIKDN